MKLRRIAASTAVAIGLLLLGAGAASAQNSFAAGVHIGPSGRTSVDLAFFHNDLAPYGRWVSTPVYGEVFVPRIVRHRHHHRWRPYMYGHWVYTDYGWTWVSSEPFGWATYHYGRWVYDSDYGWMWIPGTEWGPAWVDWQESNSYIGWAALPPTVGFNTRVGLDFGAFDVGVDLAPESFVYVPQRSFLVSDVADFAVPEERSAVIFRTARNITNYAVFNGSVVDQPFAVTQVERFTGQRVPRFQLASLPTPDPRPRIQGNRLALFRPAVIAPQNARTAERIAAESRRADAPVRVAQLRGVQAQVAAVRGRRAAARYEQSLQGRLAANAAVGRANARNERLVQRNLQVPGGNLRQAERQQAAMNARERQNTRFRAERQQAAMNARERQNARFQAERQQAAMNARGRQNARLQAERRQVAVNARERQNARFQAQAERNQRAQIAARQEGNRARAAERNNQRAQIQAERGRQAWAQQNVERQNRPQPRQFAPRQQAPQPGPRRQMAPPQPQRGQGGGRPQPQGGQPNRRRHGGGGQ
jgi:uncharacterized protein DUF6600